MQVKSLRIMLHNMRMTLSPGNNCPLTTIPTEQGLDLEQQNGVDGWRETYLASYFMQAHTIQTLQEQ